MSANLTSAYSSSALIESTNTLSRKVIVNVDDLGLSEPINQAVLNLARKRLITASSYMVGGEITQSTLNELKLLNVDIGLHLDFTGIFDTALPKSLAKLLKSSSLRRIDANTVEREIKLQFDIFEDTFNHAPRFVDGHQHVHQFAIIRKCLMHELLTRYATPQGKMGSMVHSKASRVAARVTTPIDYDVKSWVIYALGGHEWKRMCQQSAIATNTHFGGVYDFKADTQKLAKLWDGWLNHCPMGVSTFNEQSKASAITVIMCHPALADCHWQDDIKAAREREYEWMMSGALKQLYDKHFVELVHWKDIAL